MGIDRGGLEQAALAFSRAGGNGDAIRIGAAREALHESAGTPGFNGWRSDDYRRARTLGVRRVTDILLGRSDCAEGDADAIVDCVLDAIGEVGTEVDNRAHAPDGWAAEV